MYTAVIEALMPLDWTLRIRMYKNNAQAKLFCRIAKRSIGQLQSIKFAPILMVLYFVLYFVHTVTVYSSLNQKGIQKWNKVSSKKLP